jgi:hypothetical protein
MTNFEALKSECYGYYDKNIEKEIEFAHNLSQNGYDTIPLTWGMTKFNSLVDAFKQFKKPRRFVVMGCGIGYQCFIWNHLYPNIPCVGIDMSKLRVDWGANMIQKYGVKNVTLYSGDMVDLPIMDGDLVWQNNLLFDDDDVVDYNQRILNLRDVQIVSFQQIESVEATLIRMGMISNSRDILIHNKKGFKLIKMCEIQVDTTWSKNQEIYYYYPDTPYVRSFGKELIHPNNRMTEDEISTYENILFSRTRIDCDNMRKYLNKNEAKILFERHGLNVPKQILYTTEQKDITETLEQLDSFAAKPAHWSESVDVYVKEPGQKVDVMKINEALNKRLELSDCRNWRRSDIGKKIHFKDTEKGFLVEEYIEKVYELKVFVVFGDPMLVDLRTDKTEIDNVDYIRKENKYLNWDREHDILCNIAREMKVDFFRVDFIYDGKKLYANDITFMPATLLPDELEYTIEKRIRTIYLK